MHGVDVYQRQMKGDEGNYKAKESMALFGNK